jgi:tRNA nucleotidyltransferase/poly(A) polymerase
MGFESAQGRGRAEDAAREVVCALQEAGHQAVFAGGCVRDRQLGLDAEDFDVATSALTSEVQSVFSHAYGVGESFGVMLVHRHGWPIQVATFRTEGPYSDHRRPDHVEVATIEEDAARRDFTINGMYWDPVQEQLIDFHDGARDLESGVIRAIGDPAARLDEDHLRMLRAVRFAARFRFEIEPGTALVIQHNADRLAGISRERIGEEIRRMLMGANRTLAAELLEQMGLASAVLGDDQLAAGEPRHLASLPAELDREAYPAVLASWAIDRGSGDMAKLIERWRERLMLSNDDRAGLQSVLGLHTNLLTSWESLTIAGQKRMAVLPWFNTAVDLTAVDDPDHAEAVRARVAELAAQGDMAPSPWLTGVTLIEAGFAPGPDFTRVIDAVYDAQLESRIASPDEALALARDLFEN